jgi:membrane protease YdiL (CAAX protease family)
LATEPAPARAPNPLTAGPLLAIVLAYGLGFALALAGTGIGEASRGFLAEGVILALGLGAAHALLRDRPVEAMPVKRPGLELGLGLMVLALTAAVAIAYYRGAAWLRLPLGLALYALPLGVFVLGSYGASALGLSPGPRRGWLAVGLIVVINIVVGVLGGQLLPPGELPTPPGADLAEGIRGPLDVLALLGQPLLGAAIPEELYLRVYLQPRLARFMPLGWAIVVQALLFSALHLPRSVLRLGYAWPLALASVFHLCNGVLGGYLWSKTRSLPLLAALHLFAYPRIGL